MIFAASCNKSVLEPEAVKSTTSELKAATINTNRYVSKTGNDSNTGTFSSPYLTIQKGVDMLASGDTLYIRSGLYNERLVSYGKGGTALHPTVIRGYSQERPILDGTGITVGNGSAFVMLWDDYVTVSGFEVRNVDIGLYATGVNNGYGTGLIISANHCVAKDIIIHDTWNSGISVLYDYNAIDNCTVYNTAMSNSGTPGLATNGGGIYLTYLANHGIVKNCSIHNVWGEGLGVGGSYNVIQNNTVYDCWATNVYLTNMINGKCQRNLIYQTGSMSVGSRVGLLMGDERSDVPFSANDTIINNIVFGCRRNFDWWGSNSTNGMNNFLIANNTFVNSTYNTNFQIGGSATHSGVQIKNNIFSQNASLGNIYIVQSGTPTGITFSNNLWQGTHDSRATGSGDVVGDPKLANISSLPFVAVSYQLTSLSPAINAGIVTGLTTDFAQNAIVGLPDIGAYKYQGSNSITTTTYYNTQVSATATKTSCGTGYTGSTITYTVAANKYSSTVSQVDANNKALDDLNNNKQAYANANGTCTAISATVYYNAQVSATATKNTCGTGYAGSTVTYTVSSNKYRSNVSQSDADSKALADLAANKQAYANTNGTCTAIQLTVYSNTQVSATATKNSCGIGYVGSRVTYTVSAGKYTSTISQADANAKAASDLSTNTQSYANLNGTCTRIKWWRH